MHFKKKRIMNILGRWKKRQELRPFGKIKDAFKRIVVTGDFIPVLYNEDGILMVNIYDFLLDLW